MEEEVKMLREKMESIRGVIYEKDSQITDLSAENVSLNKEIEAIKSKWYDDLADAKKLEETLASAVPSTTAQEEIKKLEENYAVVLKNQKKQSNGRVCFVWEYYSEREDKSCRGKLQYSQQQTGGNYARNKALTAKYEETKSSGNKYWLETACFGSW